MSDDTLHINSDDLEAWKQEVEEDTPLEKPKEHLIMPPSVKRLSKRHPRHTPPSSSLRAKTFPILNVNDSSVVDHRTAAALRKGDYPIDYKVDLHGLTQEKAFAELKHAIQGCYAKKLRCVLVVTGKGGRDGEEGGVLKRSLPDWLNHSDVRPLVLMFCPAQLKHGGEGAFYLLLRRHRS